MHRTLAYLSLGLLLVPACAGEKKQFEWHNGKIINAAHFGSDVKIPGDIGKRSGPGSIRDQFDIDGGDAVYVAEQSAFPDASLRLVPPLYVRFAIDRKTLILETPDLKTYKLKLLNVYPKRKRAPQQ